MQNTSNQRESTSFSNYSTLALATKLFSRCNKFNGFHVAASLFLQKPQAVTAELSREILNDRVSSVISDDVVGTVTEKLDPAALDKLKGFLVH